MGEGAYVQDAGEWQCAAFQMYADARCRVEDAKRDFSAACDRLNDAYNEMAASYGTFAAISCGVDPDGFLKALEATARELGKGYGGTPPSGAAGDPRGISLKSPRKKRSAQKQQ